jgi:hypothetical protein
MRYGRRYINAANRKNLNIENDLHYNWESVEIFRRTARMYDNESDTREGILSVSKLAEHISRICSFKGEILNGRIAFDFVLTALPLLQVEIQV